MGQQEIENLTGTLDEIYNYATTSKSPRNKTDQPRKSALKKSVDFAEEHNQIRLITPKSGTRRVKNTAWDTAYKSHAKDQVKEDKPPTQTVEVPKFRHSLNPEAKTQKSAEPRETTVSARPGETVPTQKKPVQDVAPAVAAKPETSEQPPKPTPWYAEKTKVFHEHLEKNFRTIRVKKSGNRLRSSADTVDSTRDSQPMWYENRKQPIYESLRMERTDLTDARKSMPRRPHTATAGRKQRVAAGPTFEEWLKSKKPARHYTSDYSLTEETKNQKDQEVEKAYQRWLKRKDEYIKRQVREHKPLGDAGPRHSEEEIKKALKKWHREKQ